MELQGAQSAIGITNNFCLSVDRCCTYNSSLRARSSTLLLKKCLHYFNTLEKSTNKCQIYTQLKDFIH